MSTRSSAFRLFLPFLLSLSLFVACTQATVEVRTPATPDTLGQGLVLHLGLDGNLGDQSGNDNDDVSLVTLNYDLDRRGQANRALSLLGTDGVLLAGTPSLDLTERKAVTLAAWVYLPPSDNPSMAVISSDAEFSGQALFLGLETAETTTASFRFHSTSGNWHSLAGTIDIPRDTWVFLAATHDGTTARLYVNGNLDASSEQGAVWGDSSEEGYRVGYFNSIQAPPSAYFVGRLDEVRMYNRALTAAEIKQLSLDS